MYTVLIFPGGRQVDAVLVWSSSDTLRFAIAGCADIAELRKVGDRWISETGSLVELGAFINLGANAQAKPRALGAGISMAS